MAMGIVGLVHPILPGNSQQIRCRDSNCRKLQLASSDLGKRPGRLTIILVQLLRRQLTYVHLCRLLRDSLMASSMSLCTYAPS